MYQDAALKHTGLIMNPEVPLKGILSIAIILLIKDKPAHGGEIYQKIKEKYRTDPPRAIIYSILRRMEGDGLIQSAWDIQESGPARRMYRITQAGIDYLQIAIERVKKTSRMIGVLLEDSGAAAAVKATVKKP